jgi:hypothetical protein
MRAADHLSLMIGLETSNLLPASCLQLTPFSYRDGRIHTLTSFGDDFIRRIRSFHGLRRPRL